MSHNGTRLPALAILDRTLFTVDVSTDKVAALTPGLLLVLSYEEWSPSRYSGLLLKDNVVHEVKYTSVSSYLTFLEF